MADIRKPASAGLGFWDDPNGPWDRLQLGEHTMPGTWEVGCECQRDLETKKSKGKDGARIQDHGYTPASVMLHGTLWDQAQWKEMQRILPLIHPRKKGADRKPLRVTHPALSVMGVNTIYVKTIHAPKVGSKGECEFEIECVEYTAPKAVKKKPAPDNAWSAEQEALAKDAGSWKKENLAVGAGMWRVYFTETNYSPAAVAANRTQLEASDKQQFTEVSGTLDKYQTPEPEPDWKQVQKQQAFTPTAPPTTPGHP